MNINWNARLRNPWFITALASFIALTGKTFGLYDVPADWNMWVDGLLALLTAMGVVIDPSSDGISDK